MVSWLFSAMLVGGSFALASLAPAQTAGAHLPPVLLGVALVFLCWRGFERLLWLRFPTKVEHTSAGRRCAQALAVLIVIHGTLVILGR
ncbi:MAG: hypothetical protein AB7K52_03230 [Phycisphaerales bacterium]